MRAKNLFWSKNREGPSYAWPSTTVYHNGMLQCYSAALELCRERSWLYLFLRLALCSVHLQGKSNWHMAQSLMMTKQLQHDDYECMAEAVGANCGNHVNHCMCV